MKVFKFGGASVSSAEAVRNSVEILKMNPGNKTLVISAMGKTTNALEVVVRSYFNKDKSAKEALDIVKNYHYKIIEELWGENKSIYALDQLFQNLDNYLEKNPSLNYDYEYDQIVSYGELISTVIISTYLNEHGVKNKWVDVRNCLKTDDQYRESNILWELSEKLTQSTFTFEDVELYITQGFIGATLTSHTTTFGREGSDYTASILANLLNAQEVVIWKNVPGIMNADPEFFPEVEKLDELSYKEAIELSYSGAKVIHPKTIKPLQNKNIPLLVKSFIEPENDGTIIHSLERTLELIPVIIVKQKMALITLSSIDYSFISINSLSEVFNLLAKYRLKVGLVQQSAIDFSVVFDEPEQGVEQLISQLQNKYEVKFNTGLELITIRYYTNESIAGVCMGRQVFIEQKSRRTVRMLLK